MASDKQIDKHSTATGYTFEINTDGATLTINVVKDARLKSSARWTVRGDEVALRVPPRTTKAQIETLVGDIAKRITRGRKRAAKRTDTDLMKRASELNEAYFDGELEWNTVRWVGNMVQRLGSCTTGGPTDGDIRISDKIKRYPEYVIDYVVAHEICHRKHPNHSQAFWDYLARYPHTEKALGFIEGIAFAEGVDPAEMMD